MLIVTKRGYLIKIETVHLETDFIPFVREKALLIDEPSGVGSGRGSNKSVFFTEHRVGFGTGLVCGLFD